MLTVSVDIFKFVPLNTFQLANIYASQETYTYQNQTLHVASFVVSEMYQVIM